MFRSSIFRLAKATASDAAAATKVQSANPAKKSWFRANITIQRLGSHRSKWGTGAEGQNYGVPFKNNVKIHCVDNTNCKHLRIIHASSERFSSCRVCPAVVHRVSVMRFKSGRGSVSRQRLQPGAVYWFVLFTRRQVRTRASSLRTQFDRNTGILVNDQFAPLGTRVTYCAGRHVNHKYHLKAAVMANFFV